MMSSALARVIGAAALLAGLLAVPLVGSAGAAPAQSCNGYTATTLTASPSTVAAGGSITLAGLGVPGETVTATLLSTPNAALGSGVVSGGSTFSFGATVPLSTAPGTYTVRGTSTSCSSFVVSLTVTAPPPLVLAATTTTASTTTSTTTTATTAPTTTAPAVVLSGCAASTAARTFVPGQQVLWTLNTSGFDTTKQVRLRLRSGSNFTLLYGFAAWPAGNQVTITIPVGAAPGSYTMEQVGYKLVDGKANAANCAITVNAAPAPVASSTPASGVPVAAIVIAAVTVAGLIQLRFRRLRRAS